MICKDKVTVKFTNDYSKIIQVDKNDPRIISGELVGINKDVISHNKLIDINNEIKSVKEWTILYNVKRKDLINFLITNNIIFKFYKKRKTKL